MKKILITGGSGLLAVNWALAMRDEYFITLILHNRKISLHGVNTDTSSLSLFDDCMSLLGKHRPDVVIHTAGLTNVEECELNPDLAQEVNVILAENIAKACYAQGVKLVHISTDHLFSGDKQYACEKDKPNPVNIYAETKLRGEQKISEICPSALIIRTNFFGWGTTYRQSFSDYILNRLRNNIKVELFTDVFLTPILIDELIRCVHYLLDINASGIFNVVGSDRLSKYEFGVKLAESFKLDIRLLNKTSIFNRLDLVKRPLDMSLSNAKLKLTLDYNLVSLVKQFEFLKESEQETLFC